MINALNSYSPGHRSLGDFSGCPYRQALLVSQMAVAGFPGLAVLVAGLAVLAAGLACWRLGFIVGGGCWTWLWLHGTGHSPDIIGGCWISLWAARH